MHQADGGGPSVQQLQKVLDNVQAKDKANIFRDPVTEKIVSLNAPAAVTTSKQQVPSAACSEEEANALAGGQTFHDCGMSAAACPLSSLLKRYTNQIECSALMPGSRFCAMHRRVMSCTPRAAAGHLTGQSPVQWSDRLVQTEGCVHLRGPSSRAAPTRLLHSSPDGCMAVRQ